MKFLSAIIILVLGLISTALSQKIVGCYWTAWGTLSNTNPALCTHVFYAFVDVNSSGSLSDPYSKIATYKSLRSSYPNVKFLFSIGGANYGPTSAFQTIAASSNLRSAFAANVLSFIQNNNLHGVDIDWEYPNNQAANFVLLLQDLYNVLNPRGYTVAIAVGVDNSWAPSRYDIPNIAKYVHIINLMTYDYHGSWESQTGFNAPLYSPINTIYTVDQSTQYWISQIGASKNKLVLGIGLYGPLWTLTSSNTGVNAPGSPAWNSPLKYSQICQNIRNGWTRVWDSTQKCPYAFGNNQWVGYDDAQSIQEKINYLNNNGLGGAFFWEMSMDDSSNACGGGAYPLMTLVKNSLAGSSVPVTQAPITQPPVTQAPITQPPVTQPPATQAPTIATTKPSGAFVCPGAGLFKNPADCSSFYNCANAGPAPAPTPCGAGTLWNDAAKTCDWPANVVC